MVPKFSITAKQLAIACALYFAYPLNLSFWRYLVKNIDFSEPMGCGLFIVTFLILPLIYFIAMNLFIWPRVAKPVLVTIILISSIANFAMFKYGVYIDTDMVRNAFVYNAKGILEFATWPAAAWLIATSIIPSVLLIFTRIRYERMETEAKHRMLEILMCMVLASTGIAVMYKSFAVFTRSHKEIGRLVNTANYMYSTFRYFHTKFKTPAVLQKIDAIRTQKPGARSKVLVMILGEDSRAQNFYINGYERNTNPRLAGIDIVNFKDTSACGTSSAISVPCIFSHQSRADFNVEQAGHTENILDMALKSGYKVQWIENNTGCHDVCNRLPLEYAKNNQVMDYCPGGYCWDEVLLKSLDKYLKAAKSDTVIVLHMMGSRGMAYHIRYPDKFQRFIPACDTARIETCPNELILNAYDNSILYTDYVVAQVVAALKRRGELDSAMLFVSDHGESLGERGVYLHGLPYIIAPDTQTKVPMLLWLSSGMQKNISYKCLKDAATKPASHDNVFHSAMGLLDISSSVYNPDLDIITPCKKYR